MNTQTAQSQPTRGQMLKARRLELGLQQWQIAEKYGDVSVIDGKFYAHGVDNILLYEADKRRARAGNCGPLAIAYQLDAAVVLAAFGYLEAAELVRTARETRAKSKSDAHESHQVRVQAIETAYQNALHTAEVEYATCVAAIEADYAATVGDLG